MSLAVDRILSKRNEAEFRQEKIIQYAKDHVIYHRRSAVMATKQPQNANHHQFIVS